MLDNNVVALGRVRDLCSPVGADDDVDITVHPSIRTAPVINDRRRSSFATFGLICRPAAIPSTGDCSNTSTSIPCQ